jgi:hypothetical protein
VRDRLTDMVCQHPDLGMLCGLLLATVAKYPQWDGTDGSASAPRDVCFSPEIDPDRSDLRVGRRVCMIERRRRASCDEVGVRVTLKVEGVGAVS